MATGVYRQQAFADGACDDGIAAKDDCGSRRHAWFVMAGVVRWDSMKLC
jgi:hypothetical protein